MYKHPESALVVIYSRCGQVLLLQRADDPGFWQSVTGSLEPGENPLQAAQRELYEETGLDGIAVQAGEFWQEFAIRPRWRHRYAPGVIHNREYAHYCCCEVPCAVKLAAGEHISYQWLPAAEAYSLAWSETNKAAIAYRLMGAKLPS